MPTLYLHERACGRNHLEKLDRQNKREIEGYIRNIHIMEQPTRLETNLELLKKPQGRHDAAADPTIEVHALRIGNVLLVTFPGEPCVEVGLRIKRASPHRFTFIAGYTNGYIYYYAPAAEQLQHQLKTGGYAQEDCDCLPAPAWAQL